MRASLESACLISTSQSVHLLAVTEIGGPKTFLEKTVHHPLPQIPSWPQSLQFRESRRF
jgi:hypothetical protein